MKVACVFAGLVMAAALAHALIPEENALHQEAHAAIQALALAGGDTGHVTCATGGAATSLPEGWTAADLVCKAAATATATPVPSAGGHACGVSALTWHPPVVNGQPCGHEHGDAPPAWVQSSPWPLRFEGPFNTSAMENAPGPDAQHPTEHGKHEAMKGYAFLSAEGVDVYVRYHAATNVLDRMARFHSLELWLRDGSGRVSHIVGWMDTGDPTVFGPGGRRPCGVADLDMRPEVTVAVQPDCRTAAEQWYFVNQWQTPGAGFSPFFSILVDPTTFAFQGEAINSSFSTWRRTGSVGTDREGGLLITPKYGVPVLDQPFYTTQFLEVVSGPSDPKCSGSSTYFGQAYQNVCLQQQVSSALPTWINSPGPKRDYSASGVRLPN